MTKQSRLRTWTLAIAVLFGLTLVVLSVVPLNRMALGTRPSFRASQADIIKANHVHVTVHLVLFGSLACAAWLAAQRSARSQPAATVAKISALAITGFLGYFTELLQHLHFRNPLEINDIVTNTMAVLVAFSICEVLERVRVTSTPLTSGGKLDI